VPASVYILLTWAASLGSTPLSIEIMSAAPPLAPPTFVNPHSIVGDVGDEEVMSQSADGAVGSGNRVASACPVTEHGPYPTPPALEAVTHTGSGAEQQATLYARVRDSAYEVEPPIAWPFAGPIGQVRMMAGLLFSSTFREDLTSTFRISSDVREERTKSFHTFGVTGAARFETEVNPSSPYTGLFVTGAPALIRLSIAADKSMYTPGAALKFFVDGKPSVNMHAIPNLDALRTYDFFEQDFTNKVPVPQTFAGKGLRMSLNPLVPGFTHLPLTKLAETDCTGKVSTGCVRAPEQLLLRGVKHFDATAQEGDFRDALRTMFTPGDTLFEMFGRDGDEAERRLGRIVLTQPLVASAFGDRQLHFHHSLPQDTVPSSAPNS
jgi:hypothetical protein